MQYKNLWAPFYCKPLDLLMLYDIHSYGALSKGGFDPSWKNA